MCWDDQDELGEAKKLYLMWLIGTNTVTKTAGTQGPLGFGIKVYSEMPTSMSLLKETISS